MARPRIALIGAGSMGRNHARIISMSDAADLAVVIDPVEEVGKAAADLAGVDWSPSIDSVSGVDAVVVAASTEHHYAIAKDVIAARKPLLIEKPVCPSLELTSEILELSKASDVPVMCGLLERFNPAVMVAKRMIDAPVYVRADRHSPYAKRIRTGVAWDLLVHDVDLICQLMGDGAPVSITPQVGYFHPDSLPGAEDVVDVALSFSGGTVASASASRLGQRKIRSMTVQGLDSMVEIDLLRRGVVLYRHTTVDEDRPGGAGYRQATEMEVPEVAGAEPLAAQFERFIQLVEGEVDADQERSSILPSHQIVAEALGEKRVGSL
ncbi:Gfo/Idh/MocA family protein [Microbacterium sp. HA-8]|uniref:Gfo/Idh/MocA family protein n=1 Tax=Microbacterium sp. HA-8 TaxID=3234200 RepID=UPI0038F65709